MNNDSDFSARAVDHHQHLPSPFSGIECKVLEHDVGEIARATEIVRYAASLQFSTHMHEFDVGIFVDDGIFKSEHGRYPAGSWILSPDLSAH